MSHVVNGHWSCNLWCFSFALVIYESTAIVLVNKVIDVAIQGLSNPPSQGDKVSRLFCFEWGPFIKTMFRDGGTCVPGVLINWQMFPNIRPNCAFSAVLEYKLAYLSFLRFRSMPYFPFFRWQNRPTSPSYMMPLTVETRRIRYWEGTTIVFFSSSE